MNFCNYCNKQISAEEQKTAKRERVSKTKRYVWLHLKCYQEREALSKQWLAAKEKRE